MVLKEYAYKESTYQFDDSNVPDGAVEVRKSVPVEKAAPSPKNKARTPDNKGK